MKIAILAGDGVGPEVVSESLKVLQAISVKFGHQFELKHAAVGGAAYEQYGSHLPEQTLEICRQSDAILFGSVGGPLSEAEQPKWKNCEINALLGIRKAFSFYANLRPCDVYPELLHSCPLKNERIEQGASVLVVRELLGDLYFGAKQRELRSGLRYASDLAEYNEQQIADIARVAFRMAASRKGNLVSVDKANVLQTSKLWREVVNEIAAGFPEVRLSHMLVDNCAMQLVRDPSQFDVILTSNMFGDILSDIASVLPGSLGMTPSASLSLSGFGLYEPSGGSAPDIAGMGIANPSAQILSLAMMLRLSFGLEKEALAIENALRLALREGARTKDIAEPGSKAVGSEEFTKKIIRIINSQP